MKKFIFLSLLCFFLPIFSTNEVTVSFKERSEKIKVDLDKLKKISITVNDMLQDDFLEEDCIDLELELDPESFAFVVNHLESLNSLVDKKILATDLIGCLKNKSFLELSRLLETANFLNIQPLLSIILDVFVQKMFSIKFLKSISEESNNLTCKDLGLDLCKDIEQLLRNKITNLPIWFNIEKSLINEIQKKSLKGHDKRILLSTANISKKLFATASEDGIVKVWDKNGELLFDFNKSGISRSSITSLKFSKSGKFLAAGDRNNTIQIWDMTNGLPIHSFIHEKKGMILALEFLNEEKIASASDNGSIKLWDLAKGELLMNFNEQNTVHTSNILNIAVNKSGSRLISGDSKGKIVIWNLDTGSLLDLSSANNAHTDIIRNLLFVDDSTFASASYDKTVKVWRIDGQLLYELTENNGGHKGGVFFMTLSNDKSLLASCCIFRRIIVWDFKAGKVLYDFNKDDYTGAISSLAFSENDQKLLSAGFDRKVRVWSMNNRKLLYDLKEHNAAISSVNFLGNRNMLTASWDNTATLWNLPDLSNIFNKLSLLDIVLLGHKEINKSSSDLTQLQHLKSFDLIPSNKNEME